MDSNPIKEAIRRRLKSSRVLNWAIGIYAFIRIFAFSWLEGNWPLTHWLFVATPIVLGSWLSYRIVQNLKKLPVSCEPSSPPAEVSREQAILLIDNHVHTECPSDGSAGVYGFDDTKDEGEERRSRISPEYYDALNAAKSGNPDLNWKGLQPWLRRGMEERAKYHFLPYRRIESGDYWRLFCILWLGHLPMASAHIFGFYFFTLVAIFLLCALITITVVECYVGSFTFLAIGCVIFVFSLLTWERYDYVEHYGVPIVEHFFEKPEYDAKYYVEAERLKSDKKYKLLADIHVNNRMQTTGDGENFIDQAFRKVILFMLPSCADRDISIRRLHFPNGGSVAINEQDGSLSLDNPDPVSATDSDGDIWEIKLLNESAH